MLAEARFARDADALRLLRDRELQFAAFDAHATAHARTFEVLS